MTGPKLALADLPNWPRFLSEEEAAAYVRLSPNKFRGGVGTLWPAAIRIGRRKLYDRLAIDRAVDSLSRPEPQSPAEKIRRGLQHAGRQVETR